MPRLLSALSLALSAFLPLNLQSKERVLDEGVREFVQSYCIKCHGPDEEKGDRAFHELALKKNDEWVIDLSDPKKTDLLHDILDQLNLGEMPPKKNNVRQPRVAETKHAIAWLTQTLLDLEKEKGPKETVLRRLNRKEYRNTMRDLLGLQDLPFDFTENFPTDENDHCLLYTSPSPRDGLLSRMPSSA